MADDNQTTAEQDSEQKLDAAKEDAATGGVASTARGPSQDDLNPAFAPPDRPDRSEQPSAQGLDEGGMDPDAHDAGDPAITGAEPGGDDSGAVDSSGSDPSSGSASGTAKKSEAKRK